MYKATRVQHTIPCKRPDDPQILVSPGTGAALKLQVLMGGQLL